MNVIVFFIIYRKDQEKGNDCVMYVVEKYTGDLAKVEQPTMQPNILFFPILFCTTQSKMMLRK